MSLCSWPPRLGWGRRGTSAPLLRGRCRLAWLPWGAAAAAVTSVCPSPAGRSQRRRVSSTPATENDRLVKQPAQPPRPRPPAWILTVAAPLTCTDLLAMDRVPGTRSTDKGASFCFASAATISLEEEGSGGEKERLKTEGGGEARSKRLPGSYAAGREGPGLCRGPPAEGRAGDGAGAVGEGWKLRGRAEAEERRGSLGTTREGVPPGTESGPTFFRKRQTAGGEGGAGQRRSRGPDRSLPGPSQLQPQHRRPAGCPTPRRASAGPLLRAGGGSWRDPARSWATAVWEAEAGTEEWPSAPHGDAGLAQVNS